MIHVTIIGEEHGFWSSWNEAVQHIEAKYTWTHESVWFSEVGPGKYRVYSQPPRNPQQTVGIIMDYDAYQKAKRGGELE